MTMADFLKMTGHCVTMQLSTTNNPLSTKIEIVCPNKTKIGKQHFTTFAQYLLKAIIGF